MRRPEFPRTRSLVAATLLSTAALYATGCGLTVDSKEKWSELSSETTTIELNVGETFSEKAGELCSNLNENEQNQAGYALNLVNDIEHSLDVHAGVEYRMPINLCEIAEKIG
jgi:hypothetical protein